MRAVIFLVSLVSESLPVCQNHTDVIQRVSWSGQQDLNLRPAVPKTAALPGCAIPRRSRHVDTSFAHPQQAEAAAARTPDQWPLPKIEPTTRSPGLMPSWRAVPAITSSTARTGAPDGMRRSD